MLVLVLATATLILRQTLILIATLTFDYRLASARPYKTMKFFCRDERKLLNTNTNKSSVQNYITFLISYQCPTIFMGVKFLIILNICLFISSLLFLNFNNQTLYFDYVSFDLLITMAQGY